MSWGQVAIQTQRQTCLYSCIQRYCVNMLHIHILPMHWMVYLWLKAHLDLHVCTHSCTHGFSLKNGGMCSISGCCSYHNSVGVQSLIAPVLQPSSNPAYATNCHSGYEVCVCYCVCTLLRWSPYGAYFKSNNVLDGFFAFAWMFPQ